MKNRFVVERNLEPWTVAGLWVAVARCDVQGEACLVAHLLHQHELGQVGFRVVCRKTGLCVWQRLEAEEVR